jgi:hypothetical protein
MPAKEFSKNRRETIRVAPVQFQNHDLIDVRVFVPNPSGELGPTRKGISVAVDLVPDLIDALIWALGQPCEVAGSENERVLSNEVAENLARAAFKALSMHGSAVHWDTIERMVAPELKEFSKWDLHYVLYRRSDLFERSGMGCFRAKRPSGR